MYSFVDIKETAEGMDTAFRSHADKWRIFRRIYTQLQNSKCIRQGSTIT